MPRYTAAGGETNGRSSLFALSRYGYHSASCDLSDADISSTHNRWLVAIEVPANEEITKVAMCITLVGTLAAGGANAFGIYDESGTKIGQTVDNDNFWTTAGWRELALETNIAAEAEDRIIYVLTNVDGYSAPPSISYAVCGTSAISPFNKTGLRRTAFSSNGSSIPSSIDPTTLGTLTEYLPLIALG